MTEIDPGDRPVVFEWDSDKTVPDGCYPEWLGKNLPMWFKMLKSVTDDGTRTVKLCSSFADSMRMGYSIPAPCDIEYGYDDDGEFTVTADGDFDVTVYGDTEPEREENSSFTPPEFAIPNPWKIHTPDDCATFITYPMNRPSNDFRAYSMYVDTDDHDGRIPIPVGRADDDTEGVIEAGTIVAQAVPIQRDGVAGDWRLGDEESDPQKYEENLNNQQQTRAVEGFYRRFCWEPKPAQRVSDYIDVADIDGESPKQMASLDTDLPDLDNDESPVVIVQDLDMMDAEPPLRGPKPAKEFGIPTWMQHPEAELAEGEAQKLIADWARQSLALGWMMPFTEKMDFEVDGDDFEYDIDRTERWADKSEETAHGQVGMHPDGRFGGDLSRFPIPFKIVRAGTIWKFRTPTDYSLMIREPLNHRQRLYRSWSGWADADNFTVDGNSIGNFRPTEDGEYEVEGGEANCSILAFHRDAVLSPAKVIE